MVLSAKILCSVCSGNADHKYKKYSSINTFRCTTKSLSSFHFCQVDEKTVRKEIKKLRNKQGGTGFRLSHKTFDGEWLVFCGTNILLN